MSAKTVVKAVLLSLLSLQVQSPTIARSEGGALPMAEKIFEPIPISYRGLIADSNLVDGQQFGRSVIGISKIANSVCHELLFGQVTHDPRSYHVRFCVLPSRENGLLQEIVAVVVSGLPLFSPFAMAIGKTFIEQMVKGMIHHVLQKPSDTAKALDVIAQMAEQQSDYAQAVQEGHMADKEWLQSTVSRLVDENRRPLRELPEPIGKSVRTIQFGAKEPIVLGARPDRHCGRAFVAR